MTALLGMPGSGKTATLAEVGVGYRAKGWDVWSNSGFDFGMMTGDPQCHVYNSFDELAAIPGPACILIDEAQLYFNARRWQDFPDGFLYRLSQVRKDGVHLFYTTLFWDMIDKNLRSMTYNVWECEAGFRRGHFVRRRYPPLERRTKDQRPFEKQRVKVALPIVAMYDTYAKVAVAPKTKVRERDSAAWALPAGSPAPAKPGGAGAGAPPRELEAGTAS